METKKKIFLYPSDIAAYIGQNQYDYVTPFEKLWKRCDTDSYNEIINQNKEILVSNKKEMEKLDLQRDNLKSDLDDNKITERQYKLRVKKIDEENKKVVEKTTILENNIDSIDLNQEERLIKTIGQENVTLLQSKTVETEDKKISITAVLENMNISKDKKNLLKRETESFINKTHGTLREDSAIEMYEKKFNVKLDTSQKFFKQCICNSMNDSGQATDFEWYIGGRLDGLYIDDLKPENSYIIEVKNRMRGFFTTLRDYEKTQIHLYMYLLNIPVAKLIEKYQNKIRITVIYQDDEYLKNILSYLDIFIQNFETKFLNNTESKVTFVNNTNDQKKIFCKNLYLNDIYNEINRKLCQDDLDNEEDEDDCLIDL